MPECIDLSVFRKNVRKQTRCLSRIDLAFSGFLFTFQNVIPLRSHLWTVLVLKILSFWCRQTSLFYGWKSEMDHGWVRLGYFISVMGACSSSIP
jgi:hypothetical protein